MLVLLNVHINNFFPFTENSTGRVFIYHLDNHTWSLNYTLESVTGQNSYFGHSVDIFNDTIVVGAKGFQALQYHSQGMRK